MANRLVSKIMMNEVKDLVGKVSQSNHYLVSFSALNPQITEHLGGYLGIRDPIDFLSRKSGLLCSDAVLPTTSYATGEVKDNFMGIPQEFAHTRLYTDIDFSFYIAITNIFSSLTRKGRYLIFFPVEGITNS